MLSSIIIDALAQSDFLGIITPRDFEMFIKGYSIGNILYAPDTIDRDIFIVDTLIVDIQRHIPEFLSWGNALLAQAPSYYRSRNMIVEYWKKACAHHSDSQGSSNYLDSIRAEIESLGISCFDDIIEYIINTPLALGMMSAKDFESLYIGLASYGKDFHVVRGLLLPLMQLEGMPLLLWDEDFIKFVQNHTKGRIKLPKGMSVRLSAYCYFIAAELSLEYLRSILKYYRQHKQSAT